MGVDSHVALAGVMAGFLVGLTGMGGGALMTPILIMLFHVQPLAAVSSDLVASLAMKPIGAAVHLRRHTVDLVLVRWLCVGSVPAAFAGVLLLKLVPARLDLQQIVRLSLGATLLLATAGVVVRMLLVAKASPEQPVVDPDDVRVLRGRTVAIGIFAGLLVGMTSVGSGSLIIVLLMACYPSMGIRRLVGCDLVQAVPLVASAALGHLLWGDFRPQLTISLLVGAIPAVYLGARASAAARGGLLRPVLGLVTLVTGLKLLSVPTQAMLAVLAVGAGITVVVNYVPRRSRLAPIGAAADLPGGR